MALTSKARTSAIVLLLCCVPSVQSSPPTQSELLQDLGRYADGDLAIGDFKAAGIKETDISAFLLTFPKHPLRLSALRLLTEYKSDLGIQLLLIEWSRTSESVEPSYILAILDDLFTADDGAQWARNTALFDLVFMRDSILEPLTHSPDENRRQSARHFGNLLTRVDTAGSVALLRQLIRRTIWEPSELAALYRRISLMRSPEAKELLDEERKKLSELALGLKEPS
jgi:hypothetical protein